MTTTNPHSLPVYLLPTHKDGLGLDCTQYEAVMWNPYNGVVQCHACGTVFVASDYELAAGEASAPGASPADENFARLADQARQVGAVLKVEESSDADLPDPFAEAAGASSSAPALRYECASCRRTDIPPEELTPDGGHIVFGSVPDKCGPVQAVSAAALPTEEANDG